MSQTPADKRIQKEMDRAMNLLGEQFEAVLILASVQDDDGNTYLLQRQRGNQHTVDGMMDQYLMGDDDEDDDVDGDEEPA